MPPSESAALAIRLREVRVELYGEHSGPLLAEEMRIPFRTLANYESGVTLPAVMLLRFIKITGACAEWLRSGEGPRYSSCDLPGRTHPRIGVADAAALKENNRAFP